MVIDTKTDLKAVLFHNRKPQSIPYEKFHRFFFGRESVFPEFAEKSFKVGLIYFGSSQSCEHTVTGIELIEFDVDDDGKILRQRPWKPSEATVDKIVETAWHEKFGNK